jgi:hypothetical protein
MVIIKDLSIKHFFIFSSSFLTSTHFRHHLHLYKSLKHYTHETINFILHDVWYDNTKHKRQPT